MNNAEQQFLNDLDKRLWSTADKLLDQFAERARLEAEIRKNLAGLDCAL